MREAFNKTKLNEEFSKLSVGTKNFVIGYASAKIGVADWYNTLTSSERYEFVLVTYNDLRAHFRGGKGVK